MEKSKAHTAEGPGSKRDMEVRERLEKLKREYNVLNEQRIATDRDRQNLEEQLKNLKEKAEREYGTSDIDELRALLEKRREENERMVEEYRKHVSGIKERLEAIENPGADAGPAKE